MKLITRDTDYAIRALCFIARRQKGLTSVSELVSVLGIPRPFLRKLLQTLNKKRLVKSYKGKGGGFRMARLPRKIIIADLMRIFQGPLKISEHVFKNSPCPERKVCKFKQKLDVIERYVVGELKRINLESIL
ncbi:MAG: Rrf2 family transcriptional regulator [Candidatus Omnitrophica bacterium]|nr:Rrf2 family transcriptional regulator [Candidatus Omnitrophota bacterium]